MKDKLISCAGSVLLSAMWATARKHFAIPREELDRLITTPNNSLLVFWHDQILLMAPMFHSLAQASKGGAKVRMLSSQHRDGRLVASIVNRFNIESTYGSSTRGGASAVREMIASSREGYHPGLTPDGPKGPRREVKPGAGRIAQIAKIPLLPMAIASASAWRLNSWDQLMIPKPFARLGIALGPLCEVPQDATQAEADAIVVRALTQVNETAEGLVA